MTGNDFWKRVQISQKRSLSFINDRLESKSDNLGDLITAVIA